MQAQFPHLPVRFAKIPRSDGMYRVEIRTTREDIGKVARVGQHRGRALWVAALGDETIESMRLAFATRSEATDALISAHFTAERSFIQ